MELVDFKNELENIKKNIEDFTLSLNLEEKRERIAEIEELMLDTNFWNDNNLATKVVSESKFLKKEIEEFEELNLLMEHSIDLIEYLKNEEDDEIYSELTSSYQELKEKIEKFTLRLLLSEPYDNYTSLFEVHAGAGGSDATDCAEILLKMYERFFTKQGLKYSYINYQRGDICGIKSATLRVEGDYSYGLLKGEKGVHRFIRISPFDPSGKRHTSFCSIDVIPEFSDDEITVELNQEDLKIDTYRAQGAGGQHINTTDSAVRITHIPTGIVVQSQSERSQITNKETALKELKSKLYQMQLEEKETELSELRGEQKSIGWGSQIKSYVFTPYTLVKDHRTNHEVSTIDKVMNGEIFDFIDSYLHYNMNIKLQSD
ncbi:peptide chain release factor 2 [Gemelliphila palaticanis]|uniref:Peptide chain release factor 2 n=1 Tax=Gemelliphila palaticanis TaxID=81950 RepID=A0ABX2T0Q0_9BACL|nr:peptide chain release factor 2 [Gemella palaticanis]MBF0716190.1 peptide chain release factor 2 [Gemella palaticanis]NYS48120.1 peptide chain release factor 2 [Gemella palaticanis]